MSILSSSQLAMGIWGLNACVNKIAYISYVFVILIISLTPLLFLSTTHIFFLVQSAGAYTFSKGFVATMADGFPVSQRLARIAHSDNVSRQSYVFVERYRLSNLWYERRARGSASEARERIRQVTAYLDEAECRLVTPSTAHLLAVMRLSIAVDEQRVRTGNREAVEAAHAADMMLDYLGTSLQP